MTGIRIAVFITVLFFAAFKPAHAGLSGAKAPAFTLSGVDGRRVSLDEYQGRVVGVVFWATWCRDCREELLALDVLLKQYRSKGLTIIAINVDAAAPEISRFLDTLHVSFPVLIDANGHAGDAYRVTGLPTSFLIDRKGLVRHRQAGFGKDSAAQYAEKIVELLEH